MQQQEYKEIDLIDLLLAILKKWKLLIIAMLVFALLGTGFGFIKANKSKAPTTKADLASLEATMTEEELSDVKSAASIIGEYRVMYNSQKSYNENSIYQKLDPFDIKTATLKYYVDNDYKVSYPIIDETNNLIPIIQTYISVLKKDSLYERMSKEIDSSIIPLYFSEMVSATTENLQDTGLFEVKIMADTNEHLEKMIAIVKDELNDSTNSIANTYGDHTLTLAFESVQSESNSEVYDQQQLNIQKLTTITKAIADTENTFSGNQLTYLKALIHEELEETVSVVKYSVIGAFLGLLFVACVVIVKYLVSGTIKTSKEIETTYGIEVLGAIDSKKDETDIINTKLGILTDKMEIKDLCLVVDGDFADEIKGKVTVDGVNVVEVADVENNSESLKKMAESSAIVLAEKLDVSKTSGISFISNHAKQYEIPIIGAVVLA